MAMGTAGVELNIRRERRKRGWSQTFITAATRIPTSDYSQLERGLSPIFPAWRRRLTDLFQLPADFLFSSAKEERRGAETARC